MSDIPKDTEVPIETEATPPAENLSPQGIAAIQGANPSDTQDDDKATVHVGKQPETEPSPETQPETVRTKPIPPKGWTPGGPEQR